MVPRFAELLRQTMETEKITQVELARRGPIRQAVISQLLTGGRKPPRKHLPALAAALGLTGTAAKMFILAGEVEHAPPAVQEYVRRGMGRRPT